MNTDFWLDKIKPEFTSYTGVTSLAAKQVCHVATQSTVLLCHLWPVAPVAWRCVPCVPCGPSCPLLCVPCGFCGPWGPWGPFVLCFPFAALSIGGSCVPLCPLWPPTAPVFVVSPVVPVSSVSLVAPVPLERGTLAKPAKTRHKFSEWPPNHQKPERGFKKFYINSCTSLIATELDLSEEIIGK